MVTKILLALAVTAHAALQGALPQNCSAVTQQEGKSTFCPCTRQCIDGTTLGNPGQCAHYYDFPQVCGELDKEPSCSSTEALTFVFLEDQDDFGHPAPGLGSCSGSSPCANPVSNTWHKQNVDWKCCSCPEGYIAGAPHCPPANFTHVPNWGQCWRCSDPDEELYEYEYSFYKCIAKCTPSDKTCDFYQKLEQNHNCGPKGYAMKYGYPNCQKFIQYKANFSAQGQVWLKKVRKCLQERLVPDCQDQNVSCAKIEQDAFASHPDCYVKTGFCDLPSSDWKAVRSIVGWDIAANLGAVFHTLEGCAGVYETYAEQWAKKVERGVQDKLEKTVCGIVPSWCS